VVVNGSKVGELIFLYMGPLNMEYVTRFKIAIFWYDGVQFGT
jgi:hypothetical protein